VIEENVLEVLTSIVENVGEVISNGISLVSNIILFVSILYVLVSDKKSIFERMIGLLPLKPEDRVKIETDVVRSIFSIFKTLIHIAVCNAIISWMAFDFLHIKFKYTLAFATGAIGLFPLIPGYIFFIPIMIYLFLVARYFEGIVLGWVGFFILDSVNEIIIETTSTMDSLMITNTIDFGLDNFGAKGVIYGPIIGQIVGLVTTIGQILFTRDDPKAEEEEKAE
jgi:predicted PurR-regulated permease PerM